MGHARKLSFIAPSGKLVLALADGRRIVGFPHDAATYLIYYLGHDHHHRGQIVLLARLLGHPVRRETMAGMWQLAARARE